VVACGGGAVTTGTTSSTGSASVTDSETAEESETDTGEPGPPLVTHAFGPLELAPYDDSTRCVQWTVNNEQALYLQSVLVANTGALHHSNWYLVPEDEFPGPDGYFSCEERGVSDIVAALKGTVLFAQSTQSYTDEQRLTPGAVVKLPARHKVIATVHTLNASPRVMTTELWMSLELAHPADVTAVVAPMSAQYTDLEIPAGTRSRFTTRCDFAEPHLGATGTPLHLKVHYILPHYHYLGDFFEVRVLGGARAGEVLYTLDGFNGEANGVTFDPPIDLLDATGIEFSCGYDNWTGAPVSWGNGAGEMCVVLVLTESDAMLGGVVSSGSTAIGVEGGVTRFEGECFEFAQKKTPGQGMPTPEEVAGPLYLPPVDDGDLGVPPIPECHDVAPSAAADTPVTLTSIRDTIFTPSCTFSSCHGSGGAAGLDLLNADDLRGALLDHDVVAATDLPLIAPGDPEGSWLYQLLARCEPLDETGAPVAHMPRNAPILLEAPLVAKVRAWIEAGALDD
jgi:hypothetical protein